MKDILLFLFLVLPFLAGAALLLLWFVLTQPLFFSSREVSVPEASRAELTRHVYAIADVLSPRSYQNPETLDQVAGYIANEWEEAGLPALQQVFSAGGSEFKNVFIELGPDTEEVVVIGAHYDAFGPFPGADDNASGVAGIIELGKMLAKADLRSRVIVIGYPLEEPPHFQTPDMGSYQHAASLKQSGKKILGMISLEMIGYFSDEAGSQKFPFAFMNWIYPSTGNFIGIVSDLSSMSLVRKVKASMRAAGGIPAYSINAPQLVPGIAFSDHASYLRHGFPALMITDTAFYRNPNYHTDRDRPETLDYRRMAKVIEGAFEAVKSLANGR